MYIGIADTQVLSTGLQQALSLPAGITRTSTVLSTCTVLVPSTYLVLNVG